jgi:hypothetical protein
MTVHENAALGSSGLKEKFGVFMDGHKGLMDMRGLEYPL